MGNKGYVCFETVHFYVSEFRILSCILLKLPRKHETRQAKEVAVRGLYVHRDRHSNSVCQ